MKYAIACIMLIAGVLGSTIPANASVNWSQRTCSAFTAWQHHRSGGNLALLMRDSTHVPWKYLGEDSYALYGAVRSGKDPSVAEQYLYEDCHSGYGA